MEGGEVTVARLAHALRRFWALGVAVVLGGGVLAGSAIANAPQSEPDLVALLPTTTGHVAPIYVDTHTVPGKELYRFSAVIKNLGGIHRIIVKGDAATGCGPHGFLASPPATV